MPDAGDQQRPAVCGGVGCGWTRAFGAALAAEGARGTGKADQAGVVGALRASRAAARAAGQRLPGVLGRFRLWRELGGGLREIGGARGRQRRERVSLGKAHSEAVRGIERKEGAAYRSGLEGSEDVGGGEDGRAAHCITIILLSIGTRSRAGCGRSGWSRCGRSTESRLTRR